MVLHPVNGKVWATEMGRDLLGDDIPPDEVNIVEEGKNYGWPICYGKNIHDTDFDKNTYFRNPCMEPFEAASHIDLQAHSAPLGIAFIPEDPPAGGWPEDWWHNAIVAYHGSWNRTEPTGYKLVRLKTDASGRYRGIEDFITGWLAPNGALGRPVDVLIQPGGTMFVSDDKAGVIYRITRNGTS
jgi:glucose/arabinose dehydrogenase